MVRTRDADGIKSNLIISEVQTRPCLFDTNHPNYGDRAEKSRCWEEVCQSVVPGWLTLGQTEKFAAGKEVQKRWRSIRDSYTKTFRQGKCLLPEQCSPNSRRYQYHSQMAFLLRALQNKKPRYSQDIYESFSEVSNSPQHPPPEDVVPKIKTETTDKPLDLKTKEAAEKPETVDKCNQAAIDLEKPKNPSLEIKIDANSILPDDHFDDDRLFMNSLIPLFKKMNDDTRLLCRIEVLKIIRYALQGHKCFEALKMAEDSFFKDRLIGVLSKQELVAPRNVETKLSMTTRSADGSRPVRKRRARSPTPVPVPVKRRGPGRPRKIRPPPSDSEEEQLSKKRSLKPKVSAPAELYDADDSLSTATSVAQLSTPLFMKMYNLERSKTALELATSQSVQVSVKTEPLDADATAT